MRCPPRRIATFLSPTASSCHLSNFDAPDDRVKVDHREFAPAQGEGQAPSTSACSGANSRENAFRCPWISTACLGSASTTRRSRSFRE